MYFTANDDYQNFLVFAPLLISLMLADNKKVTNWVSIGISSEKNKPFNTNHVVVELSKLNDAVENDVFKKTEYDELVNKLSAIKTTDTCN